MCLLISVTPDFRIQLLSLCNCNDAYLNQHQSANSSVVGRKEPDQHPGNITSVPRDYKYTPPHPHTPLSLAPNSLGLFDLFQEKRDLPSFPFVKKQVRTHVSQYGWALPWVDALATHLWLLLLSKHCMIPELEPSTTVQALNYRCAWGRGAGNIWTWQLGSHLLPHGVEGIWHRIWLWSSQLVWTGMYVNVFSVTNHRETVCIKNRFGFVLMTQAWLSLCHLSKITVSEDERCCQLSSNIYPNS